VSSRLLQQLKSKSWDPAYSPVLLVMLNIDMNFMLSVCDVWHLCLGLAGIYHSASNDKFVD